MKKILYAIMFPLIAISCFVGCGCEKDRSIGDVQKAYIEMVESFNTDGGNKFFDVETDKFVISIQYPTDLKSAIDNTSCANDTQKRYRALFYQQEIISNIFAYYSNNEESFYTYTSGKDVNQDEINNLYNKVKNLHEALKEFEIQYNIFIDATEKDLSDIMKFNITTYSYYLNSLIDSSFDFIYTFQTMYEKYGCENEYDNPLTNLNTYVDKAYLDISYIVYLEDIKSFNHEVGENGVCDLSAIIGNEKTFEYLELLENRGAVSSVIVENYGKDTEAGILSTNAVNAFVYSREVFEQRLNTYVNAYNSVDNLTINQYKFELNGGIDYDSYLKTLSSSEKATIILMDSFVNENFNNYITKLKAII